MMTYTKEEFLKAAEIGEVSMIDAKHIVSLLDEARDALKKEEKFSPVEVVLNNSIKKVTFANGQIYVE